MGWAIGFDSNWKRDIGYGVPAICDHPGCGKEIDRGLSYVCGGEPYGGDVGCGLYFCSSHLAYVEDKEGNDVSPQICECCVLAFGTDEGSEPFKPTPDVQHWIEWKLTDYSWQEWLFENPEFFLKYSG